MPARTLITIWFATMALAAGSQGADLPLVADRALQPVGLTRYWEAHLPLVSQETVVAGFLVDESLYVTSSKGVLYALDANVGLIRWAEKIAKAAFTIDEPTHVTGSSALAPVVIPTTAKLYAINRFTGKILQTFDMAAPPSGLVVGLRSALFLGGADGRLGAYFWESEAAAGLSKLWHVDTGGLISAGPVLFDENALVFGTKRGCVFACGATNKELLWSACTGGSYVGKPAIDGIGAYLANANRSLYKFHLDTGRVIWRTRFEEPLAEGPLVVAHTVFQYCPGTGLSVIDADTGRAQWVEPLGRTLAAHLGERDVVFRMDRRMTIVDHETGKVTGTADAPRVFAAVPNGKSDAAYLLGRDGQILCVRPSSAGYPKSNAMATARRTLRVPPESKPNVSPAPGVDDTENERPGPDNPFRSKRDARP